LNNKQPLGQMPMRGTESINYSSLVTLRKTKLFQYSSEVNGSPPDNDTQGTLAELWVRINAL